MVFPLFFYSLIITVVNVINIECDKIRLPIRKCKKKALYVGDSLRDELNTHLDSS